MSALRLSLAILSSLLFTVSCSVVSQKSKIDSGPAVPFKKLAGGVDNYRGKAVVLGGYILETNVQTESLRGKMTTKVSS